MTTNLNVQTYEKMCLLSLVSNTKIDLIPAFLSYWIVKNLG